MKKSICDCIDEAMKLLLNLVRIREAVGRKEPIPRFHKEMALKRMEIVKECIPRPSILESTIKGALEKPTHFALTSAIGEVWFQTVEACRIEERKSAPIKERTIV